MANPEDKKKHAIQINEAVPEDAAGVLEVQKQTWLATYPNEEYGITLEDIRAKDFDSPERVARWRESFEEQSGDKQTWVAKDGDKIIGLCLAKRVKGKREIGAIYVLPGYQGKKIGQDLMARALEWLGSDQEIVVGVAKYNTAAIEFYRKTGFELVGDIESAQVAKLPSGKTIPEVQMVRKKKYD